MSQRVSGYDRKPDEAYYTPAWVTRVLVPELRDYGVTHIWEPAVGNGSMSAVLETAGFKVTTTDKSFFTYERAPPGVDAIVTNPPYGKGSRIACEFIQHSLKMDVKLIAMLLRVDFDSAKTRTNLFRDNRLFSQKLVLLNRIKWFEGESQPSDNHAWFVWSKWPPDPGPVIQYVGPLATL